MSTGGRVDQWPIQARHGYGCAFDYKPTLDAPPSDQKRQIKDVELFIG